MIASPATHVSAPLIPRVDLSVPTSARVWDYWLGGKNHFAADRALADAVGAAHPDITSVARLDRAFLSAVVEHVTRRAHIRQLLDIGTGFPAASNTHEIAQTIAPDARVVYVDHDPIVMSHATALLSPCTPAGRCGHINADLADTDHILTEAALTLDLTRPVAVLMLCVLHFAPDPRGAISRLMAGLAPGSYLAISHATAGADRNQAAAAVWNDTPAPHLYLRAPDEIRDLSAGLDLIGPGAAPAPAWLVTAGSSPVTASGDLMCSLARTPAADQPPAWGHAA